MLNTELARRRFLNYFAGAGLSSALFPGILWAQAQKEGRITVDMIREAEKMADLAFTDEERDLMLEDVNEALEAYEELHNFPIGNGVAPAIQFNPVLPSMRFDTQRRPIRITREKLPSMPENREEIAFWPVTRLSRLIRSGQITSLELTHLYLERLKRFDSKLHCVVTLTEELALRQAARADEELARGVYRGPLHGIPWGAKDLLAARGYRTTWGAAPFKDQVIDEDATVVSRLEEAGAVLIAKLTLGALAWGDVWFGEKTRNPWNPEQGSSGSSAGSAASTSAGLVAFAIGTETLGSIVSPCTRCGVTGLRPTFGRVSRHGAMALSWSMDKIGPICRTVEDCALVFDAIYGPDAKDDSVQDFPFNWDAGQDLGALRIGYLKSAFNRDARNKEALENEKAVLKVLPGLGLDLKEFEIPTGFPRKGLGVILNAEAAAAFDELTRSNQDDLMVRQIKNAWPNAFRHSRLIPAVEYIQANRARRILMGAMEEAMADIDVFVAPSFGGANLLFTNLTGHPSVVLPNGFNKEQAPTSITFTGRLFGEAEVLAVAKAYQDATDFHGRTPPGFA